jgi:hypothetical protein
MPIEGYDLKGAIGRPEGFSQAHLTGMHTHDDAFAFFGNSTGLESPFHIRDFSSRIMDIFS